MDWAYSMYNEAITKNQSYEYYAIKGSNAEDDTVTGESVVQPRLISPTDFQGIFNAALAVNSLIGLIFSQFDVVTAFSVVAALEARAKYDPTFRDSFPKILRRNSWFL